MACLGGLMAVKLLVEDSLMKMEWKFVVDDDVMVLLNLLELKELTMNLHLHGGSPTL